ncbi:MAG: hypothetical protein RLY86_2246, partial [Pseudomonadota bacterium]
MSQTTVFQAAQTVFPGSNFLTVAELELYHALNDLRVSAGLSPLKPTMDLTVLAGQHAYDFETFVGYATWQAQPVAARSVPTLHHWSDGRSFASGVVAVAQGLGLSLPSNGLSENAQGSLAGFVLADVLNAWTANPGAQGNILAANWDSIGIGVSGGMAYVTFGLYRDQLASQTVPDIIGTSAAEKVRLTGWADFVLAGGGNDTVTQVGAGDRVDGGTGLDAVMLGLRSTDLRFSRVEGSDWIEVRFDGGMVQLRNVEYLVTTDRVLDSSAWGQPTTAVRFDAAHYLSANPDVAAAVQSGAVSSAEAHFWSFGAAEGRSPAAFFDPAWYLRTNPGVAEAVARGDYQNAFAHFLLEGQFRGLDPNPYFDADAYLAGNV